MHFASVEFIYFALAVLFAFYIVNKKYRWIILLAASYFFYGYNNVVYLLLILFSTLVDFFAGKNIYYAQTKSAKKGWLILSLFSNLSLLFYFKYHNFLLNSFYTVFGYFPVVEPLGFHQFILPLGISFYTFQTISYTVDIYRGYIPYEKHLGCLLYTSDAADDYFWV